MTDRRGFLTRVAAAGVAASLPTVAEASAQAGEWDDSWTARVRAAKHRVVFDAPDPADGLAFTQAWVYQQGYQDALGAPPSDLARVVVMRHAGVILALDDAMWAKYGIGEWQKIDDPATSKPAARNPWSSPSPGGAGGGQAGSSMAELRDTGTIFLACNLALTRRADQMAKRAGADAAAVRAELRTHLVPGVILQPSGIYATARAQEMGCVFMRST